MAAGIGNALGKAITVVTKTDAKLPIVALEATVVGGRTKKAYDRGGVPEARERVIEETSGSIVWLWGVQAFNWIGDKIIGKILGLAKGVKPDVDTGHDALRKPFNNFLKNKVFNPKNYSERAVSLMKFGKVAASVLAANYIIGFIVPPLNHKITNAFAKKDEAHIVPHIDKSRVQNRFENFKERVTHKDTKTNNVAFKGGLNTFTNFIENTNTGQLLSTDLGVLGGRTYNARKKEEKVEIVVRDGGSIYFYMWSQGHTRALLNKVESGRWTRLDPNTAKIVHEHLAETLQKDGRTQIPLKEFKQMIFGDPDKKVDLDKFFKEKEEVITLDKFNEVETNPEIRERARAMSELQPKQLENSVLSRAQVEDVYNNCEMNSPKMLKKSYETFTEGTSSNPNKYVSNKTLTKLKGRMADYAEDICKAAEKNGGNVDIKLLEKMKNKNLMYNGINFLAGFTVASMFLSTFIPDIQYWITRKTTGRNDFPGTCDYGKKPDAQPVKAKS